MRVAAPLAVMYFALINSGLIKYKSIRDRAEKGGGHIYGVADLERYVVEAGFEGFSSHAHGSNLVFGARKRPSEHWKSGSARAASRTKVDACSKSSNGDSRPMHSFLKFWEYRRHNRKLSKTIG